MAQITIVSANLGVSPRDANLRIFSRQAGGAGSLPIRFDAASPNPIYAGASSIEITLDLEGEWTADLPASDTYDVPQEYALYNGATLLGYFSLPDAGIPSLQFSQLRRTTRPVSVPALLSAVEPVDPAEGEWWFDTTSNRLSVRHSGAWVTATSIGTGGTTVVYRADFEASSDATGRYPITTGVASPAIVTIRRFTGSPGQTHTEHQPGQGIHVTEGGIYTAELWMDISVKSATADGAMGIRIIRGNEFSRSSGRRIIHDSSITTIPIEEFTQGTDTDRQFVSEVSLTMSRFDEGDYLYGQMEYYTQHTSPQVLTVNLNYGSIRLRRYEGEQGIAARGVTLSDVETAIAAAVNPHALRGNAITEDDFDRVTRDDIRNSVDVNGISISGRQISFVSNDARTNNPVEVPGILLSEENDLVDVGTQGATQIQFHGSNVTVSRVAAGIARVTITGGGGEGGGPTNDEITSLINSNPGVVRSGEFEAAMRYKRDLIRSVPVSIGVSNAAGRIAGGPLVGAREEDMFIEVTVAGDAVHRFLQTDLLDLSTVNDSDQLGSGNSIVWTGDNSGNGYRIAHAGNGEILFSADSIGSYNLTIVADHIDLESFARRSDTTTMIPAAKLGGGGAGAGTILSGGGLDLQGNPLGNWINAPIPPVSWAEEDSNALVPADRLGTGTADGTTVLHGDGTWQTAATGGGGDDAADWAEDGNTDLVPVAKLGTGTADSTKVLYGDSTWKDASTGGLSQTEVNALINARVQDPAEVGNTDRWAKNKVPSDIVYSTPHTEAVFGAFAGTDKTTNSTTITVQGSSYSGDPSLATLRSVPDSEWVSAQEVGPRVTNVWIAIRVPIAEDTAVQNGEREMDVTESQGVFDQHKSNTWTRKGTNVVGTFAYYTVEVADLPSGAMFLVREQHELELVEGLVNAAQFRRVLGLVGGIRYTYLTPTLQTSSSSTSQATSSIAVSPAADLDDALYRHGEWHIHVTTTTSVATGTDVNYGFEQKANQTAEDRTAEDTAIILVSTLRASTDRTGGVGSGGGGVRVIRRPAYSLNTLLGYWQIIINRDTNNNVGVIGYFETAGGNAQTHRFSSVVRIVYHPSDAPTLTSLSGLTQGEVDGRVRALVDDWAEAGNASQIPDGKIPTSIARDSEIPTTSTIDSRADARIVAGVQNWARDTTTAIPANKLSNAPSGGGGLTQSQVDGRVRAIVENFAEVGNNAQIPDSKIPSSIARDSEIPSNSAIDGRARALIADWAEQGNASDIPDSKIPSSIARDSEVPSNSAIDARANARVNALVENFAKQGNNTRVQTAKLGSGTADATKVLYGDATWKDAPSGTTTFTGLTDTPSTLTGEGGKFLAVNSGATAVELVDAPTFTLGDSAASLSEVKLTTAVSVPTTTVGAWTSWATLLTSSALTHAGVMDIGAVVRGNVTTDTTGGGDRVYVETRLVRTRSSVDTMLDWSMLYVRNGGNFGTQALEDASQVFEKDLNINDTGAVGDTYKIEYRVISQGNLHTVQFTTDSKIQVVNPGSGSPATGGTGLTDAQANAVSQGERLQEILRKPGAFLDDNTDGDDVNNLSFTFTGNNTADRYNLNFVIPAAGDNDLETQIKIGSLDWISFSNADFFALNAVAVGATLTDANSIALTTTGTIYRFSRTGSNELVLSSSVAGSQNVSLRRYEIDIDTTLISFTTMTQAAYDALAVKTAGQLYLISG